MKRIAVAIAVSIALTGCFPTHFTSCEDVHNNGAAPLYEGDDGWNPALDADGDGVACEL